MEEQKSAMKIKDVETELCKHVMKNVMMATTSKMTVASSARFPNVETDTLRKERKSVTITTELTGTTAPTTARSQSVEMESGRLTSKTVTMETKTTKTGASILASWQLVETDTPMLTVSSSAMTTTPTTKMAV